MSMMDRGEVTGILEVGLASGRCVAVELPAGQRIQRFTPKDGFYLIVGREETLKIPEGVVEYIRLGPPRPWHDVPPGMLPDE